MIETFVDIFNAEQACNQLQHNGHDDWRLPTRIELLSIATYRATGSNKFWTSSSYARKASEHWVIDIGRGFLEHTEAHRAARCVRAGNPGPNGPEVRFSEHGNGLWILDYVTGLTWEKGVGGQAVETSYSSVQARCEGLGDGFRVPTIHELHSLVDDRASAPALAAMFQALGWVWSSTPVAGAANQRWVLTDLDGETSASPTYGARSRCVKDGT